MLTLLRRQRAELRRRPRRTSERRCFDIRGVRQDTRLVRQRAITAIPAPVTIDSAMVWLTGNVYVSAPLCRVHRDIHVCSRAAMLKDVLMCSRVAMLST